MKNFSEFLKYRDLLEVDETGADNSESGNQSISQIASSFRNKIMSYGSKAIILSDYLELMTNLIASDPELVKRMLRTIASSENADLVQMAKTLIPKISMLHSTEMQKNNM